MSDIAVVVGVKGPVIIYRPVEVRGGGGERAKDFRGDHLIFGRTKGRMGGSFVTKNQKGGIAKYFLRIQRGTTKICLENEDMGGGDRKSRQKLLAGIISVN